VENEKIWEKRYSEEYRIAKWPFDQIVSMVMRRFASAPQRSLVKVLDYGCGGGNNFWFLIREGFDGYACDIAPSAIAITRRRLKEEGYDLPDVHFSVLNDERLPYPDHFFSAIIDRESLCQSTWPEVQSRVKEFQRILVPGGWYLGVNFSCHHPDIRHADYLGCGDWHNFRAGLFENNGSRHLFSVSDIFEMFAKWNIESLAEQKTTSIVGGGRFTETSEYLIAAQTPMSGE